MKVVRTVRELRDAVRGARAAGLRVGFVPTMGAFHEGHLSLMWRAGERTGFVVVSLFVNPAQFNDPNDLARYPRDAARDTSMAESAGAALLFMPDVSEVYPPLFATSVEVRGLSQPLEGVVRGTEHFRGVTTVVAKLLNMVQPDETFFGQKDAQQALIVRRMAEDLDIPVAIEICPTVREPDGLAMSSRNVLLDAGSRGRAPALYLALSAVSAAIERGERDGVAAMAEGRAILSRAAIVPEYFDIVSTRTLEHVERVEGELLVVIAARFGSVRLIDNVISRAPEPQG